jgi:competence protein ComEC
VTGPFVDSLSGGARAGPREGTGDGSFAPPSADRGGPAASEPPGPEREWRAAHLAAFVLTRAPGPAHGLAAALCLGLALANLTRAHAVALAGAVVAAGAVVLADTPAARLVLTAVLLCALGWWWASVRLDAIDRSPLAAHVDSAGRVAVVVTAPPRHRLYEIRVRGRVTSFDRAPLDERVELRLPLGRAPPQGAILEALAVVRLPRGPADGFDERAWLRRHGVHVVLHVSEWEQVGARGGLGGVADRLRSWLREAIAPELAGNRLAGERRAVLRGIVLGDDEALSDELRRDFRAAGLYHLLAVSGQNVVIVAGGVLALAWLLGIGRWVGELGALAAIAGYVLAVGGQPSVVRAGIAAALASLAWLTGRLRDAWYALLLGAIALLAWNPYLLFDPGFQLSFAAVAAIFTLVPGLVRRLEGYPIPRLLALGVAVSTACGLATAPILWLQFGALPLFSVPANALAEPAMPVLLGLAFVTAALGLVSPDAAALVAALNGWVAGYIALCAHAIGSLPFAEVRSGRGLAALLGTALAAAYAWRRWRTS